MRDIQNNRKRDIGVRVRVRSGRNDVSTIAATYGAISAAVRKDDPSSLSDTDPSSRLLTMNKKEKKETYVGVRVWVRSGRKDVSTIAATYGAIGS